MSKVKRPFEGVIPNLQRLYQESESEFTRNRLKAFMAPQFCDACNGQRLKSEILAVRLGVAVQSPDVGRLESAMDSEVPSLEEKVRPKAKYAPTLPGLSIMDVCSLSVERADDFFATLKLTEF